MGTAVLAYSYVISIRNLSVVQAQLGTIQQQVQVDQDKVRRLIADLSAYGKTNTAIIPLLESEGLIKTSTNMVVIGGGEDE